MRAWLWSLVLLTAAPAAAGAEDAASARAFVRQLYAAYHGKGPDYLGRQAPSVFAPALLRLIRRDAALTPPGDVGTLDGDPICDCQDFGRLRHLTVTVADGKAGQIRATARFQISAEWRTVRLDLAATPDGWRISDIHTADTPSLAGLLQQAHPRK